MNRTGWFIACSLAALVGCTGGSGGGGGGNVGSTPASTAEALVNAATKNEPQHLWHMLPASYQKDVNEIISTTANSLDETLYNDTMKLASNVGRLLSSKGDWIIAHPMVGMFAGQAGAGPQELKAAVKSLGTIISSICDSEIKTKAGLANLDVGAYLTDDGAKMMEELKRVMALMPQQGAQDSGAEILTKLGAMQIELVSTEGDVAKMRVTTTGESPAEFNLLKVDGKWVPEDLAKEWPAQIAKMKTEIAGQAKMSAEDLAQAKMTVGQIGQVVEQLLNAKSEAEFNASLNSAVGMMMGGVLVQ
ncbi:MAG: hypothetical protein ACKVX7_11210 [Planctomycetota bacterium]